jgi:hypothetical protein
METNEIAAWPDERLESEICRRAADLAAAQAQWFRLLAEFDRRSGWASWGCRSAAQWLSWQCGLSTMAGREHVRVARRLAEFPATEALFAAGKLSYSKVRALTRVLTPANEQTLIGYALEATASQLERIVRGYRSVLEVVGATPDEAVEAARTLHWRWEDDGMLSFAGRVDAEEGAALLVALGIAHDELHPPTPRPAAPEPVAVPAGTPGTAPHPPVSGPVIQLSDDGELLGIGLPEPEAPAPAPEPVPAGAPRSGGGAAWADALGVLVDTMLAAGPTPAEGRAEVVIEVDLALLAAGDDDPCGRGAARIPDGPPLATHVIERVLCDCNVETLVVGPGGTPLDLGRSHKQISPRQRRALRARDGGCQWPGCEQRRFVDGHHLIWWSRGGPTDLANLALFCRRHHRHIHRHDIAITREADGRLRFFDRGGEEITTLHPSADVTALPHSHGDLCAGGGPGVPYDLGLAVTALLGDDGLLESPA